MIDPETGELKRSVFKEMRLNEVSAVDKPAQPGATMSIMKRAADVLKGKNPFASKDEDEAMEAEDEGEDKKKKPGKKKNPFGKRAGMTAPDADHQHLLTDEVGPDMRATSGETMHAVTKDGNFHAHPWIRNEDGTITIGKAHGHSHDVTEMVSVDKQASADVPDVTDASNLSGSPADSVGTVSKEATMSQQNDQTDQTLAVAKQLEEANARVARAEAVAELNDAQRGIFKSLDAEGQDAFLALTPDAREGEVTKSLDANAVVEVVDGVEYRKSDDPRLLALAKSAASEKALRIAGEVTAKAADLRKRAEALHLPGTVEVRMSILKGIDSLPADEQGPALESLAAQDAGMAKAFESRGTSAVPSSGNELNDIAKSIRTADPSLSVEQAMAKALDTPEGAAAYSKSLGI
tara:strand:+ start:2741 stop:3961 length:1221 start_codon:yes stop_codon:yes gene_type:complete